MIISTHCAEKDLAQFIETLAYTPGSWRALHVHLNNKTHWDIAELQQIARAAQDICFEHKKRCDLFFCDNGHFIALIEYGDSALESAIRNKLGREIPSIQKDAFHVYDLNAQLASFNTLVQSLQATPAATAAAKSAKGRRKQTIDKVYAEQILAQRDSRKGFYVLLVEDDLFTLDLISSVLQEETVIKTTNGNDALEAYYLNAPDMVFLDINIPGMDGHEVLKKILDFDPEAYIVMLSGQTYMKDVSGALNSGAKGFVSKPFPKEKLLNYITLCKSMRDVS